MHAQIPLLLQFIRCKEIKLLFILLLFTLTSAAQKLEWRYEYDIGLQSWPSYFWVDADGNGYFNVTESLRSGADYRYNSLLILNKDGLYSGSVSVKNCKKGALLLPFENDQYVSSGSRCGHGPARSYLLSYEGKILKTDDAFVGGYFSRTPTDYGATFFSSPLTGFENKTYMSIGSIDQEFKLNYDSIPMQSIQRENLGLVFNFIDPVQLDNKTWVLPFNYGKVDSGISVDHGSVFCVKDQAIIWQYPDTLSAYTINEIAGYKNTTTLYMRQSKNWAPKLFIQLDEKGNVIKEIAFRTKRSSVKDMLVDEKHIILLFSNSVIWYDWDGQLLKEFDLTDANIRGIEMSHTEDDALIISGTYNRRAVFMKVSGENIKIPLQDSNEESVVKIEEEIKQLEIQYAEAKLESETVFSASVFPNPTSIRINFELTGTENEPSTFRLEVFDVSGKKLFQDQFNSHFYELNVFDFAPGPYVYRISDQETNSKEFVSGKFIKI